MKYSRPAARLLRRRTFTGLDRFDLGVQANGRPLGRRPSWARPRLKRYQGLRQPCFPPPPERCSRHPVTPMAESDLAPATSRKQTPAPHRVDRHAAAAPGARQRHAAAALQADDVPGRDARTCSTTENPARKPAGWSGSSGVPASSAPRLSGPQYALRSLLARGSGCCPKEPSLPVAEAVPSIAGP